MARAHLTFLILHPLKLIRADFGRGSPPVLLNLWQQTRPDIDDPELLVDVTAAPGGRLGRKVWLLSADLFAQTLRLDAKSMGLAGDELSAALAFEAEPLSGISGVEAAIGYQQLRIDNGEREFSVVSARRDDIVQLRDAVCQRRGRLVGVTATASVPITTPDGVDPFSDDDRLREWLTRTAQLLSARSADVPMLLPPKEPLSSRQRGLIAVTLAVVAVALCCAHYYLFAQPAIANLRGELKQLEAGHQRLADGEKRHGEMAKNTDETTKQMELTKKAIDTALIQRGRVAGLLALIGKERDQADKRGEHLLITRIEVPDGDPCIHGMAMEAALPSRFADNLGPAVAKLGWRIEELKSGAKEKLANDGPWEFEIRLKDVLAVPDAKVTADNKKTPPPTKK